MIAQYDKILLKSGQTATVVEVLESESKYIVDVDLPGPDWETVEIKHSQIQKRI